MWINNNDNNEILKVELAIIIIGFWKFGLMIIIIVMNRFWEFEVIVIIIMRFLKVWVNDDNNSNKWMLIVWNDNND